VNGQGNSVAGLSNTVAGANNIVQGTGNIVGNLSKEDQDQMMENILKKMMKRFSG
jgi:prophage DNA circulation protein